MASVIESFEAKELKKRPFIIKIADRLTTFFGSITFLTANILFFILWLLVNNNLLPEIGVFDPFPYPLLTTIVSLEAIFLTIVVLISQQRQSQISTIREEIDMQINRIAESEITKALLILKKLAEKQGIKVEDKELADMLKVVKLSYIERKLEEQMNEKPENILQEVVEDMEEKIKSTSKN